MKKKLILAAVGLVSVFTLAACSTGSQNIATMKGGTITVKDFYDQTKASSTSQSTVKQMIIYKVFEEKYGKDVSDKDVQAEYDKTKKNIESQGYNFDTQLKQYGYTEKTYKAFIKQTLAYQAGLKAHIDLTDEDLKTAWENFHPEVEAQIIQVATEDEAKEIKTELDNGGDFSAIAKEKSTDTATKADGGSIKFDSQTTTVPPTVSQAAFKLKDGEVSDPIAATDSSTYKTTYYLVKMVKNQDKGNDMDTYKSELKKIAETTKTSDQTFVNKVISEELTAANVKIKDDAFKDVLAGLLETDSSKSSDSATSSSAKSSNSSSKTEDSSSSKTESSK